MIINFERIRIIECFFGFDKTHSVFGQIGFCLLFIPFKDAVLLHHTRIVRIFMCISKTE